MLLPFDYLVDAVFPLVPPIFCFSQCLDDDRAQTRPLMQASAGLGGGVWYRGKKVIAKRKKERKKCCEEE